MSAVRNSRTRGRVLERQGGRARSYLLELPLELRLNIYSKTLALAVTEQLSLLSTSKQICDEGHEFIFQRPLTCSSRLRLQAFIDSHRPSVLAQIRNLRLRLEEPAPAAMQSYLRNAIMDTVQASDHPYVTESEAVLSCLRMMPNIKNFSLLPPHESNGTSASREFIQYLLTKLPQHLQQLRFLSIRTEVKSLDFLINMPQLRSLYFSGCSETDPQSASSVMKQMTYMQEFTIISPSTTSLKRQKCRFQKKPVSAITPDILCNIQPLKKLSIRDMSPAGGPFFLTTDTLKAIYDTHRSTLRSLCISALSQPSLSVLKQLQAVTINMPMLRDLQVEWPNVSPELVSDCLPSTIQSLTVAIQRRAHAQDIIKQLTLASSRLPYLRDLHFNLIDAVPEDVAGERQRQLSAMPACMNTRCETPHWRITWGTWQPAGDEGL